jgi:hypothetical protein
MAKAEQAELDLLGRYRLEAAALDKRISEITSRRKTLESAITGLRELLRSRGFDDAVIDAEPDPRLADGDGTAGPRRRLTTIDHAVNVLVDNPRDLGVKEIHQAMRPSGFRIEYWALSKALNREASRPNGRIVKVGSGFRVRS